MGFNRDYPEEFERLWLVCPREMKKAKPLAYEKWLGEGFDDPEQNQLLIDHIEERKRRDLKWLGKTQSGEKYIPMFTTFVNQRRWEDDYERVERKMDRYDRAEYEQRQREMARKGLRAV